MGYRWQHLIPVNGMAPRVRERFRAAIEALDRSPPTAAANVRLAIRQLCEELCVPGEDTDAALTSLVKAGLPEVIRIELIELKAVRANASLPGQLGSDDWFIAIRLFDAVNQIEDHRVSRRAVAVNIFQNVPLTSYLAK